MDKTGLINWGELNVDLLDLILSKLFAKDRLSFSLVCRHWNAVAATSPYGCSSPCLMYYYWRTRTWKFYQYNTHFNESFPDLENAELRCSKYGWLLMLRHDDTLFFYDPSNNRKIELPAKLGPYYISLCFFNPPTSPDCVVVGLKTLGSSGKVQVCTLKHGEDEWEIIELSYGYVFAERDFLGSLGAPALHRGLIYFLSADGDVLTLDIEQQRLDINFKCWRNTDSDYDIKEQYLVKVDGDEALYGVFVFDDEREVHVYRLSSDMKWDMVEEGTGDKVFYLSNMSSFAVKARSKTMAVNTMYFPMFCGDVPVFYSLSDEKYHSIDGAYLESNAYGLKRLNGAAWLMPMPVQEDITTISWLQL